MATIHAILNKFRKHSFSERDKGARFEHLMKAYLKTDPKYSTFFSKIWMWNEFPFRHDFGGQDIGIDLVALTETGEYWAVQCKCYQEDSPINKDSVDSFLSASGKTFHNDELKTTRFAHRLWISTTNNWTSTAEETLQNQVPPVTRINLTDLENAPVDWGKLEEGIFGSKAAAPKKDLYQHQELAVKKAHEYFKTEERGKLIMACGTGKTFTSLKIAEKETDGKGLVLFLVPSIALLGQTLNEWSAQANEKINAICICSDAEVSRKTTKSEDGLDMSIVDLALPATTNHKAIVHQLQQAQKNKKGMTVVFSTYQSISVISKAQKEILKSTPRNGVFDLIICDEAHRTTGVTLAGDDESEFVKVHNNEFLKSKRRLYMTATPRLYSDDSKSKAAQSEAILCSMDDKALYGDEIYRIGFGEAVERQLLSDYKVLILTISDTDVPAALQSMVASQYSEINTDDASKLVGCINALSKRVLGDEGLIQKTDPEPMRRAVAFCQSIKVSKKTTDLFNDTRDIYYQSLNPQAREKMVYVEADHVDGTMGASKRDEKLSWLKNAPINSKECRMLTNVRCLSEGVDVPSLDAVLFLSARNSQVDVVQSVGRVMRRAPGKKFGYIIIPVVVPSNITPEEALNDNKRYAVVWTVLNALRAHDDRFNAIVNKIELNKKRPQQIIIGSAGGNVGAEDSGYSEADASTSKANRKLNEQLQFQFEQYQDAIYAKMVQKVGDRRYWEQWAKDVAQIVERHIERITKLVERGGKHQKEFDAFLDGLRKNINPGITQESAIEMLAQHLITQPVFEALFDNYSFARNNPISKSMQSMINLLEKQALDKDTETLSKFYESVRKRAEGIDNAEGKQKIIIELYDNFFKAAFPKMVEKLGIVYTPIQCVDFIIKSTAHLLEHEFGRNLSDENVHILDPFTGTGTFIVRLLQSGLIRPKDLLRKYTAELHANEIVLLAYYIASVNIENAYHDLSEKKDYTPFDGICLTDTFQLGESDNDEKLFSKMFPINSARVEKQKKTPIRVIMANPPYSIGQKSANDNSQNENYPRLFKRITDTYVERSEAALNKGTYDSYIKAFRWSTDRLDPKHGGIISFISNASWLDGQSTDGFRKCIEEEFSSIYVFNLRGNQRTQGELSRKEGGKIFGGGSRTPISITFLVKNPDAKNKKANIYYHDIGDYLSRDEKLDIIQNFGGIDNKKMEWDKLLPNAHGDWINQRNDKFSTYIPLTPEKKFDHKAQSFFTVNAVGLVSARDPWVYNFSEKNLAKNMERMIENYNEETQQYKKEQKRNTKLKVEDFINTDESSIKWSVNLKNDINRNILHSFEKECLKEIVHRPFCKETLYFDHNFIERPGLSDKLFPSDKHENKVISVSGSGGNQKFSTLITETYPDFQLLFNGRCFPLYWYEEVDKKEMGLFDNPDEKTDYIRHDAISDFILDQAKKRYGPSVKKEDIFYYVYGFLHSPDYTKTFASDLKKDLPHLPLVEEPKHFWAFSKAGRTLADLHLNYETQQRPKGVKVNGEKSDRFEVEKMRFPPNEKKSNTIIYNSAITIENIPQEVYDYVVNGRSPVEWIMERYQVTIDKDSGIKNDPNDWGKEHDNPRYILDLLLSVMTVSLETQKIVATLPKLTF